MPIVHEIKPKITIKMSAINCFFINKIFKKTYLFYGSIILASTNFYSKHKSDFLHNLYKLFYLTIS